MLGKLKTKISIRLRWPITRLHLTNSIIAFFTINSLLYSSLAIGHEELQYSNTFTYPSQNEHKNLEGVWVGKVEQHTLLIKFYIDKLYIKQLDIHKDALVGDYTYYNKNDTIVDTFNKEQPSILPLNSLNENQFEFLFNDPLKNKGGSGRLIVTVDSKTPNNLHINLRNSNEVYTINGKINGEPWDEDFSIPIEMVLHKK